MILNNQNGHKFEKNTFMINYICNKCGTEFIFLEDPNSFNSALKSIFIPGFKIKFKHFEDGIMGNNEITGDDLESYIKNELIYCNDLIIKNIIE